jgi:PAS domain S-box-containing protein
MDAKQIAAELINHYNFLDMPIGVYVVASDGHFIACNRPVREMLKLPADVTQASLAQFYARPQQRAELLQKACDAEERGRYLEKEEITFRVDGKEIFVEDYCKPLRDSATNEIVGYIGCLVDVTDEQLAKQMAAEAQRKIETLTADIGKVWHASTSTFVMTKQTLDGVIDAFGPSPFGDRTDIEPEEIDEVLVKQATRLATVIARFMQSTSAESRLKVLPAARWQTLADSIGLLREIRDRVPMQELRAPTLRTAAHETMRLCREARAHHLPRESIKEVQQSAAELERLVCLFDAMTTRSAVIQMELPFRTLREYITADLRTREPHERLAVKMLIEAAVKHLADFAQSAHIEIQWRDRDFFAEVEGSKRDLVRVLSNLLHNAIKYTWRRERTRASWVEITTFIEERWVCVQFENWGVPIAREEIEQGLIFQLGYRGKWSTDRGRLGTGIGLTDADHVARAHNGFVRVESKPAAPALHPQDEANYYKQPFITRVTLCLPWVGKTRGKV